MTQATVNITGVGPVEVNTEASEIQLVGALTISGDHVNVKTKRVSRNKPAAKKAEENYRYCLKPLGNDCFILEESEYE